MSDSATPELDLQISDEVSRTDTVETEVDLLVSPGAFPLEGRALTFSSPVPAAVPGASVQQSNEGVITDAHSDDRVASINMNEMIDLDDRRDNILNKSPQVQASDKIGKHDVKILGFQEKIDKAEEDIHDLELIMVDRQEHGQTRRSAAIRAQLVAKRKRIQRWQVSIDDFEERKKVCLTKSNTKDQQSQEDGSARENARWDDPVIIELIKLRWDVNKNFRLRFENKVDRNEQVMADLTAALNTFLSNLNKSGVKSRGPGKG